MVTEVITEALGDPLVHLHSVPEYYLYNSSIENVSISNKYVAVGAFAFANSALKSVEIDSKIIGTKAFHNCSSLTHVTLDMNVEFIYYRAFIGCINLRELHYQGTVEDWSKITMDSEAFMKGLKIICSDGEFIYL